MRIAVNVSGRIPNSSAISVESEIVNVTRPRSTAGFPTVMHGVTPRQTRGCDDAIISSSEANRRDDSLRGTSTENHVGASKPLSPMRQLYDPGPNSGLDRVAHPHACDDSGGNMMRISRRLTVNRVATSDEGSGAPGVRATCCSIDRGRGGPREGSPGTFVGLG
jgi:hypothetical protein